MWFIRIVQIEYCRCPLWITTIIITVKPKMMEQIKKKKAWIHPSYLKHSMTFWNPTGPGPIEKDRKGKAFMKNGWCSGGHHSGFHVVSKSSWTPHLWQASPNQPIWLVVSNMLIFHFIYGIDFHIFQDGYSTTNQLLYEYPSERVHQPAVACSKKMCLQRSLVNGKLSKNGGFYTSMVGGFYHDFMFNHQPLAIEPY